MVWVDYVDQQRRKIIQELEIWFLEFGVHVPDTIAASATNIFSAEKAKVVIFIGSLVRGRGPRRLSSIFKNIFFALIDHVRDFWA